MSHPTTADDIDANPYYRRQAEWLIEGEVERIYALDFACAEAMRDYLRDEHDVPAYVNESPERLTVELREYDDMDVERLVNAVREYRRAYYGAIPRDRDRAHEAERALSDALASI